MSIIVRKGNMQQSDSIDITDYDKGDYRTALIMNERDWEANVRKNQ